MTVQGSCHCGATQFTVAKRPATVTRCTCSFCSKRGALWAYQDREDDFVLTTARDRVSTDQWGSYEIEHHHCAKYSGGEAKTTNNRMELIAVCDAIRHAPPGVRLDIVTDSKNVIGWLSQGGKRNDPMIAALSAEIDTLRAGRGCALDGPAGGVSVTYAKRRFR